MSDRQPFTAFQVELSIFVLDGEGQPLETLYDGGCVEQVTFSQGYEGQPWQELGMPYADEIHVDETHRITMRNTWLHETDGRASRMPEFTPVHTRNRIFCIVAIWYDEVTGRWNKRTYFGARLSTHEIENTQFFQQTTWRAQSVAEKTGVGEKPNNLPDQTGIVVYIKGSETVTLYKYDFETKQFVPVNPALLATRATLQPSVGAFTISFHGVTAMVMDADGMALEKLISTGATFLPGAPVERIEFRIGATRMATLGVNGYFAVPDFTESSNPGLDADFEFISSDGQWRGSLAVGRAYAEELLEPLP